MLDFLHKVSKVFDKIAQIFLALLAILIGINVLLSAIWKPIIGVYEIVSLLIGVVIAFAIPNCAIVKGHPAIDIFVNRFPKRVQRVTDAVKEVISITLFGLIAWQIYIYGKAFMQSGEVSPTLHLPHFVILYMITIAMALLFIVLIVGFYKSLVERQKK